MPAVRRIQPWIGIWVLLAFAARAAASQPVILVITSSNVPAFDEAVDGVRKSLAASARMITVDLAGTGKTTSDFASQAAGKDVRVVVAVGTNALAAGLRLGVPVVATMILREDLAGPWQQGAEQQRSPVGAVVLDVNLTEVLNGLARVFPGKTRVGMVRRGEPHDISEATLVTQARAAGMKLTIVDCPRPDRLLPAFLALKSRVDFVWCPPDAEIYNGTTVKPLILASIENQLPVAGFSSSFVRAGAAAGVYPDYRDIGQQTGELVRRFLASGEGGDAAITIENPRKTRIALNQRVIRLLGLRLPEKNNADAALVEME